MNRLMFLVQVGKGTWSHVLHLSLIACAFIILSLDMYLLHWPEVPSGVKDKKEVLQDTWRMLEVRLFVFLQDIVIVS